MLKTCVIGASGYTGSELAKLLYAHPGFALCALFVSEHSADAGKALSDLYPGLCGSVDLPLQPISDVHLHALSEQMDAIFLATPHEASHDWMADLAGNNAKIFDLSGAFRLKDPEVFARFYGFQHQQPHWLANAVYGLAEWRASELQTASVVAVPGCYPTASLLALKPLQHHNLLDNQVMPIINAVSGVSGAGRKAALNTSLCEVSLQAYGVLGHRHQPEISSHLGTDVIFTPHLGNFKRGILATITVKLNDSANDDRILQAYHTAYQETPLVRLSKTWPRLDDVVNTPYCDLHWKWDPDTGYPGREQRHRQLIKRGGITGRAMCQPGQWLCI